MEFTGRNRGADCSKIWPDRPEPNTPTRRTSHDGYFSGYGRAPGPQSGRGLLPRVGGGPHRAGPLAGRSGDLSRRIFRSAKPARRPALDSVADLAVPGGADILLGRRVCWRSVLDPSARHRGSVAPNLAAASTRPGARTVDGVRRAGVGSCSGVGRLPGGEFDSGICGLGGGDAPVVPRGLSGGGFADADCNCCTTPLGTFGARGAGNGCRGGRCYLAGWPCPLSRLAQLFALLGSSLSTRN